MSVVTKKKTRRRIGAVQKKVLLLLLAGVALSATRSPTRQLTIINDLVREWQDINRNNLNRAIRSLHSSKYIQGSRTGEGALAIVLTDDGRNRAKVYDVASLSLPQSKTWDKKWRMVLYDVPERKSNLRKELFFLLRKLGFFELQKSVYVYPYDCKKEIDYVVNAFEAKKYVRYVVAESIDNEEDVRGYFTLV